MRIRLLSLPLLLLATAAFAQSDEPPTGSLRKAIVPLVGSARGANGANFKTTLRIQALPGAHGRIVFHPLGTVARSDDPSMPYSFPETSKVTDYLQWDDVVAAMGQSGLGSLDVIPDADGGNIVPPVTTRIFNDTPAGTFGTDEQVVYPYAYFINLYGWPPPKGVAVMHQTTLVPPMSTRFRRNIGFRTLSEVGLSGYIVRKDGTRLDRQIDGFPGEYSTMMPVEEFVRRYFGTTLGPDDALGVFAQGGGKAIIYYTYTDNQTNDPALVVSPPIEQNIMLAEVPN